MDRAPLIWSAPPRYAFGDCCMRGGAFVGGGKPLEHKGKRKAPPRMQQSPNAYRGGAVQIGPLNPNCPTTRVLGLLVRFKEPRV